VRVKGRVVGEAPDLSVTPLRLVPSGSSSFILSTLIYGNLWIEGIAITTTENLTQAGQIG